MFRASARIATFAYAAALPVIYTMWAMNVLPQIFMRNFGYSKEYVADAASLYFSTYYYGIIVGCFLWPAIGQYFYKRTSLMIGLVVTCIANFLMGHSSSFTMVCVYRFISGSMHNLNSVGKDFIYEFVHTPMTRQYGFSTKSAFNVVFLFAGPYAGFLLYEHTHKDFAACCDVISVCYLIGIFFFIVFFYLDYDVEKEIAADSHQQGGEKKDTEEAKALVPKDAAPPKPMSMWALTAAYLKIPYLRGLILTYILNNAINKTVVIFMVMYTTMVWADGGLGLSTATFSYISLFSFIPSLFILFGAPLVVPSRFHYYTFIKAMVGLTMFALLSTPLFHDIFSPAGVHNLFVYVTISLIFWANPKQFSPFINFLISNETTKENRTTINSLLFLSEIGGAAICINIMAPIYRLSIFNSFFAGLAPYNKYIPFIVLSIGLASSFFLLRTADYAAVKKTQDMEAKPAAGEKAAKV